MVICLELGADLHMAQLMPLPLTVSCFSKIQIVFTFLVRAHPGGPGQRAVKRVCVCVCCVVNEFIETTVGCKVVDDDDKRQRAKSRALRHATAKGPSRRKQNCRLVKATEVTAGLAESNGSLLPGLWRDSLHVTCGLTACTPGSAPGPTLSNEYGKTLPFLPFDEKLWSKDIV